MQKRIVGRVLVAWVAVASAWWGVPRARAEAVELVRDGEAKAVIVVREDPPRLLGLAALELQHYLEKISGARLPIVHEPEADAANNIFVGRSRFTDEMGISDEGLPYGAFRMVSGPGRLVLLGHDRNYVPPEPLWGDFSRSERREIWDAMVAEVTDNKWAGPPLSAGRHVCWNPGGGFRRIMSERYGEEQMHLLTTERAPGWAGDGISRWDLGGSLNAVYRCLMDLGVRWYMPGELGKVAPEMETITIPVGVDVTVHPDYGLRTLNWSGYAGQPADHIFWMLRIGMFSAFEVWPFPWSHNIRRLLGRPETAEAHPELYALRGGERLLGTRSPQACFSAEGLVRKAVEYARFTFDHFDMAAVDLWPSDGLRHCNCDMCRDKEPTDAVWGFVDRVARELYKTHPDRLVTSGSYSYYHVPPGSIEQFSPNVAVMIMSGSAPPLYDDPEHLAAFREHVESWQEKLAPNRILRWQNSAYNTSDRMQFPVIHPRAMIAELRALRGISKGHYHNWQRRSGVFHNPGCSHLELYTLARYLWDTGQDIDEFLDEYYTLFYGPVSGEMKDALEFAQENYLRERGRRPSDVETAVKIRFREMLDEVRASAGDTVYGERVQLLIDELPSVEALRRQAREEAEAPDPRADAPLLVGHDGPDPDEAEFHRMRVLRTGEEPDMETRFRAWWHEDAFYIEFHCEEPDMENLFSTGMVHDGDSVVILIETPAFSYYHLEISPEGRVFERASRPVTGMGNWSGLAEVETEKGEDHWRVRVRLPVSGESGLDHDPNHLVAGGKPTEENPWWVNFGRSRVRGTESMTFAFSPTLQTSYHRRGKFARFIVR